MTSVYKMLPLHWLCRGRYQPRADFSPTALNELTDSIRNQGIIEPIIVREVSCENYEIIAGERRWRAAQQIPLSVVPCLIGRYTDKQAATLSLIENIQRANLNLIEEAQGYHRLCTEFNFQQQEIARLVSKSRSHVANILRLLTLANSVQELVRAGTLSLGHARALITLPHNLQQHFSQQAIRRNWSVRRLETTLKQFKNAPVMPSQASNDTQRLQTQLANQVGAPVEIVNTDKEGGWLQIQFFNNDTLTGLLERLGLHYD